MDLDFGGATFRFAALPGTRRRRRRTWPDGGSPPPTRAWSHRHLTELGVKADVIRLDGAVENAIRLGVADVIADVVETGATLRQARAGDGGRADPAVVGGADRPGRRRTSRG